MKNIRILVGILGTLLIVSSCEIYHRQTVIGSGEIESMEVETASFEGVSVTGTCNVDIVTGETQSLSFHAQQEVLEVLSYEVIDHILHIGFKPDYRVRSSKEISASIVIPKLSFVSITGAGDFSLDGDRQDLLDIHITGTGNVSAFEMEAKDCIIRISGAGNCEVNVSDNLDVIVSGVGNIFYLGQPALRSDISGVGKVSPVTP